MEVFMHARRLRGGDGGRVCMVVIPQEDAKEMKRVFWEQLEECVGQLNGAKAELDRLRAGPGGESGDAG